MDLSLPDVLIVYTGFVDLIVAVACLGIALYKVRTGHLSIEAGELGVVGLFAAAGGMAGVYPFIALESGGMMVSAARLIGALSVVGTSVFVINRLASPHA